VAALFTGLSLRIVRHFESLISSHRVRVFIIDDSVLSRNRNKKEELLARVFDHSTGKFTKGYTMLTLCWSNGFSFAPLDFVMLSSAKITNRLCEITSLSLNAVMCPVTLKLVPCHYCRCLNNKVSAFTK
jgi:hypothetical protein